MKILLIGNFNYKKKRLNHLISEHYPGYSVLNQETAEELANADTRKEISLVVVLLTKINQPILEQLMELEECDIPVLLVEEEETELLDDYLNHHQVKGYLQKNAPLDKIKKGINLVLDGGVYKEPSPNKKKLESDAEKKYGKKNIEIEWTILSMYTKGFTAAETSEVLEISVEAVESKLEKIKNKVLKAAPALIESEQK